MKNLLRNVWAAWPVAGIGLLMWTGQGWGGEHPSGFHADTPVLAAGFGFQAGGESIIVIRTYDARTGQVLSEESFDLAVIEDGAPTSGQTTGRIFAGGIGGGGSINGEGLSKFLLRVYDAQTGSFLWEGQLNLTTGGEGETAKPIARLIRPTVALKRTANESGAAILPYYLVRALDPNTGSMVWQDQFALTGSGRGAGKPTRYRLVPAAALRNLDHAFQFMVSAYDRTSEILLWVDTFESLEQEAAPEEEEHASVLPLWPGRQRNATATLVVWENAGSTSCRPSASRGAGLPTGAGIGHKRETACLASQPPACVSP